MYYFYDIEIYPNFFLAVFKGFKTKKFITFELHTKKNELPALRTFLLSSKKNYFIGFNILNYDNVILNYILKEKNVTNASLKALNDLIIGDKDNRNLPRYKQYKYGCRWISIDIFLLWSKMVRMARHVSLKSLAVAIDHPKIQELPYTPSTLLTFEEMEEVKTYCYNDVDIVENLTIFLKDKLSLRQTYADKARNNKILCYDDIKLGLNIIDTKFREKGLKPIYEYKPDLSMFSKKMAIGPLILPSIEFQTPEFNKILSFYENLEIYPKGDKFNYRFISKGKTYSLGAGGIHSEESPEIYKKDTDYLREKDVVSYYPNLLIRNKLQPKHLPKEFIDIYETIYDERILAKQNGDQLTNETNKLALNGATGMLKSEYSPLCAPDINLSITINGQLALLMLIEAAEMEGIEIFCCNTDGVIFLLKEDQQQTLEKISSWWEQKLNLLLENTDYDEYYKRDINNFVALTNKGKIKAKGVFATKKPITDSQDFLIIPKALQDYFVKGTPIETTIRSCTNIYKFCASFKVAKTYDVYYNREKQQQLNRFYPSLKGSFLFKKKIGTERKLENLLTDSPVILFNNYEEKKIEDYDINYKFFIDATQKIINLFEKKELMQLKLL